MKLTIVDVFAEARYQGNQLAVVENAAALPDGVMQDIAREMNFSETTFVTAADSGRAEVRIFTPGEELPFAGHPTLGTAWVLTGGTGTITLALRAGDVPVRFADGLAWLTPPPATPGEALDAEAAAALLGLSPADLDDSLEAQIVQCGPTFAIIGVTSMEALRRVHVDLGVQRELAIPGFPFAVCRDGYSTDADFAARMLFFDGTGMREDPATGSANAAFASYLRDRGERGARIVEQGFEIRRPSRIHLHVGDELAVGGRVVPVARGELLA
ncbi:MAG: PhzF family phenazine biosynthesis isomerase [Gammaproteobacteria bacterium]|jgi:trans-2,3-dihydro-3-hydroxyanthranilate isomerase|nr:PhzF family phenazine biosynthesis isomerase [Gammaproteobacteria bacterium]